MPLNQWQRKRIRTYCDPKEIAEASLGLLHELHSARTGHPNWAGNIAQINAQLQWLARLLRTGEAQLMDRIEHLLRWGLQFGNPYIEPPLPELYVNPHERKMAVALTNSGYSVLRKGWPDFLAVAGNRVIAVEVKNHKDQVRPEQAEMHEVLKRIGIPVLVVRDVATLQRELSALTS